MSHFWPRREMHPVATDLSAALCQFVSNCMIMAILQQIGALCPLLETDR